MSKFKKKRIIPKQLRHWVYRLTGKSSGVAYTVTYALTPPLHIKTHMYYMTDNRITRFKYRELRIEIFDAGCVSTVPTVDVSVAYLNDMMTYCDCTPVYESDLPRTYDEFCVLIDTLCEERIFKSL